MKLGTVFVIAGAILTGGIAAMTARNIMLAQRAALQSPHATIVIAMQPLGFGTPLTRDNIQEVPWASSVIPEGAFSSIEELTKEGQRVALTQIAKNEPILSGRITGPGQKASLSALIEPGMRAVTVRVDDVRGVAGFIMPGDRVDVALTRTDDHNSFTDVLLQNVKVLAIDQLVNERQEHAQVAKAVTLEVTTQQGQKLVLASGAGTMSLILRQAGGTDPEPVRRVTLIDLGQAEHVGGSQEPKVENIPASSTVHIIRGAEVAERSVFRE